MHPSMGSDSVRTDHRLLVVAVVAAGFALVCGCGGDAEPEPTPSSTPPATPPAFEDRTEDYVIEDAILLAGHLIQDSPVQEATARLTTYGEALEDLGWDRPKPYSQHPSEDTIVWLVMLKGMFYEPQGPPPLTPRPPAEPTCSELTIIYFDPEASHGGDWLSLRPAEGCE